MVIYHQDEAPLSSLQSIPQNHNEMLEITSYDEETEAKYKGLIIDAESKLQSATELAQREVYDQLFNCEYLISVLTLSASHFVSNVIF